MVRLTAAERPVSIRYRKLANPEQETRLLEIQPSKRVEDAIVSRLITVNVPLKKPNVEIVALSSLIGDPEIKEIIYVDGKPVNITAHRGQALRHLRTVFLPSPEQRRSWPSAEAPRTQFPKPRLPQRLRHLLRFPEPKLYVWLDAICINQRYDEETNRHKETMKLVYESAKLVVGWLGAKVDATDIGLTVFTQIDDAMPRFWGDPGDRDLHPENYAPTHHWAEQIQNLWQDADDGTPSFMLPHWTGANDFMYRPYFQRQWILQEIALANSPAFMIGDSIVSWTTILRLVRCLEEFKDNESDQFPAKYRAAIAELPLGSCYELLKELNRRKQWPRSLHEARESELDSSDGVFPHCGDPATARRDQEMRLAWAQGTWPSPAT